MTPEMAGFLMLLALATGGGWSWDGDKLRVELPHGAIAADVHIHHETEDDPR